MTPEHLPRLDGLLERLERLLYDGVRKLPDEEREEVADVLREAGGYATAPKRTAAAHALILDLQQPLLAERAERQRVVSRRRIRYD